MKIGFSLLVVSLIFYFCLNSTARTKTKEPAAFTESTIWNSSSEGNSSTAVDLQLFGLTSLTFLMGMHSPGQSPPYIQMLLLQFQLTPVPEAILPQIISPASIPT